MNLVCIMTPTQGIFVETPNFLFSFFLFYISLMIRPDKEPKREGGKNLSMETPNFSNDCPIRRVFENEYLKIYI